MKFLIVVLLAVLAVATSSYAPNYEPAVIPIVPVVRPIIPYQPYRPFPEQPNEYAASLAGAPLGLYEKRERNDGDVRNGWYNRGSEVEGLSLGNAKVGLYGKDNNNQRRG